MKQEGTEDYETRLLYDQHVLTDNDIHVLSSIYAIKWIYPGAMTPMSSRVRLTCVYSDLSTTISIHGGSIEKWRDGGWTLIDEFCDDREDFSTPEDARDRLLNYTQSFLLGVPLKKIAKNYNPTDNPAGTPKRKTSTMVGPKIRLVDFDGNRVKKPTNDKKDDTDPDNYNKKTDQDDPDFDWV